MKEEIEESNDYAYLDLLANETAQQDAMLAKLADAVPDKKTIYRRTIA